MKTLGVIGGVGPESTQQYYREIIRLYRDRAGDGSYPQFVINSIDLKAEIELVIANDRAGLTRFMVAEIEKLAGAGAQFGIVASNTPHLVFDEMKAASSIPLISIVETACAEAKARNLRRPALFGTSFTMEGDFYARVFAREKIELIIPAPDDRAFIHDKYMNELVPGIFLPETKAGLLAIVDRMKQTRQIDSVILGGTELPLILREPEPNGIPFLDTMKIHVAAAVEEMFR